MNIEKDRYGISVLDAWPEKDGGFSFKDGDHVVRLTEDECFILYFALLAHITWLCDKKKRLGEN